MLLAKSDYDPNCGGVDGRESGAGETGIRDLDFGCGGGIGVLWEFVVVWEGDRGVREEWFELEGL